MCYPRKFKNCNSFQPNVPIPHVIMVVNASLQICAVVLKDGLVITVARLTVEVAARMEELVLDQIPANVQVWTN